MPCLWKVLRKLRGWHARRRCVHVQHVGGWCDHEDLCGHPENYINQGRFRPEQNKPKRYWHFIEQHCHPSVCASWLSSTLSLSLSLSLSHIRPYILGFKKKKEMKQIIFVCFSTIQQNTIPRSLEELLIRGRIKTIQITALLWSTRILSNVLEIWEDLLSPKLQRKTAT